MKEGEGTKNKKSDLATGDELQNERSCFRRSLCLEYAAVAEDSLDPFKSALWVFWAAVLKVSLSSKIDWLKPACSFIAPGPQAESFSFSLHQHAHFSSPPKGHSGWVQSGAPGAPPAVCTGCIARRG